MNKYWNERFKTEKKIWGEEPSRTAKHALEIFNMLRVWNVLVPGSGYGRHTNYFQENNYEVTGIECSEEALALAEKKPEIQYIKASVLETHDFKESFDCIYCFNLIHLFSEDERKRFVNNCHKWLETFGVIYFAAFSDEDSGYGKGFEIEKGTFESKVGRAAHYFTQSEWIETFSDFNIIENGIIEEEENHGSEGSHVHKLRYMVASKAHM